MLLQVGRQIIDWTDVQYLASAAPVQLKVSYDRLTELHPVDLARIIAHSVETARPLIDARAQTLTVSAPPAPVWLSADFARLSQVVANLLNNAAKYTAEGGRIELVADAAEGEAKISVHDNGPGIEAALLPKVFDLFVQGDRSLDRALGHIEGTALPALSVCTASVRATRFLSRRFCFARMWR